MDFVQPINLRPFAFGKRRHLTVVSDKHSTNDDFPQVQMYLVPPSGEITLSDFDELATERLKVLRILEKADHMGRQKFSPDWIDFILAELKRQKLQAYVDLLFRKDSSDLTHSQQHSIHSSRRDIISHFILRLVYCRTEDLCAWFVNQETDMFRLRLINFRTVNDEVFRAIKESGINLTQVTSDEKISLRTKLLNATYKMNSHSYDNTNFYKIVFHLVPELVRNRHVLVENGFAYLPSRDIIQVLCSRFRLNMIEALSKAKKVLPVKENDTRVKRLLKEFEKNCTGQSYTDKKGNSVNLNMLDELSVSSFPPCMRELHTRLRTNHKLFHGGRLQYGLFLKAIGLSLNDAITFWRQEFVKVMDSEKFRREYLYNIRHNYGQEGKRLSYTAHDCTRIMSSGGAHDSLCPFVHYDSERLTAMLSTHGVSKQDVEEVCELSARRLPQLACKKYWQVMHRSEFMSECVTHPNQFYDESQKIINKSADNEFGIKDKVRVVRARIRNKQTTGGPLSQQSDVAQSSQTSSPKHSWSDDSLENDDMMSVDIDDKS